LKEKIEETLDHDNLLNILKNNALTEYHLESTSTKINLEKSQAKKLQPYFIQEFFTAAFERLNGTMINFNNGLYNISNVPPQLQLHASNMIDNVFPIQHEYENVCFDKNFIKQKNGGIAELLHTDHPLVKAVINMTKINTRSDLKNSSIFLDPTDISDQHYILFVIEHSLHSNTKTLSNKLFFLKFNKNGFSSNLEWSSHINLQEICLEDRDLLKNILSDEWINKDINNTAIKYTADNLVPLHYNEIKEGLTKHADKIKNTVRERLNSEIDAITLQAIELGGQGEELRANNAYKIANELTTRLHERLRELDEMQKIVSNTPILLSAVLIIPLGLLLKQKKFIENNPELIEKEKQKKQALDIVIASEEKNGNNPKNVCNEQCGWDITVQNKSNTSKPHHIKVKYLNKEQSELLLTPLEIIYGLNQADQFILAIVFFDNNNFDSLFYLKNPFSYDSRWKSDIIWPTNQKLFTMKDFMEHAKPVCVN